MIRGEKIVAFIEARQTQLHIILHANEREVESKFPSVRFRLVFQTVPCDEHPTNN